MALRNLSASFTNGDHGGVKYIDSGVLYLRCQNITEQGLELIDNLYISDEDHQRMIRAEVVTGDLLITIVGSIGNCCVVKGIEKANINQNIVKIRPTKEIDPNYLSTFINSRYGRFQIQRLTQWSVQANVNFSQVGDINVIVPSLNIQLSLVSDIEAARQSRKQKLAQADELLSSLDGYLLNQLGLNTPEESDKKVFSVKLRDVKNRCDVDYHSLRFRGLRRMLERNSSYPVMTIGEICQIPPRSGFAAGRQDQAFNEIEGIPHIRPLNIKSFGEITFEGTKYVPTESVKNDDLLTQNEVLFNNTNSMEWVGKSTVFTGNRKCACSNHVTRLLLKNDIAEPFFLSALFNALRSLGFLGILSTNFNNQAGINIETLSSLRVPIPSLSEQRLIVSEMQKRYIEAQQLRQEAEIEWESAKTHFERKLLGVEV